MRNPSANGPSDPPSRTPPAAVESGRCDVCGAPTVEIRCKIICGRCGYTRDCSDP